MSSYVAAFLAINAGSRRLSRIFCDKCFGRAIFQQGFDFRPEWVEFTFPGSGWPAQLLAQSPLTA